MCRNGDLRDHMPFFELNEMKDERIAELEAELEEANLDTCTAKDPFDNDDSVMSNPSGFWPRDPASKSDQSTDIPISKNTEALPVYDVEVCILMPPCNVLIRVLLRAGEK